MDNWEILDTDYLLDTPWVKILLERLRHRDSGREQDYFYLTSPNEAVAVVALTDDGCVLLTRQYRHPVRKIIWDLPAGAMRPDEDPAEGARRELEEETGYQAEKFRSLGWMHPMPALFSNRFYVYMAENVTPTGKLNPDETEEIETVLVPLSQVRDFIKQGKITCSVMISAIYLFLDHTGK